MSRQNPEEKMNKALKVANDDVYGPQIGVPEEETEGKKEKIELSDDILRKFLEWVPLENLPNVIPVDRRFWLYGDENLEERKYVIQRLQLFKEDSANVYHLEVTKKRTTIDGESLSTEKTVEFAEVAPPLNFRLKVIQIARNVGEQSKAMDFLRVSGRLFVGAELIFAYSAYSALEDFEPMVFLQAFDKCAEITNKQSPSSSVVVQNFSELSKCNSLTFCGVHPDHVDESLFDWLHSPVTIYPDNMALPTHKQLKLQMGWGPSNVARGLLTKVVSRIKEKFEEDSEKRLKFVVKFRPAFCDHLDVCPIFRWENPLTGEVLFSKFDMSFPYYSDYDLIRCSKEDEATMAYEKAYSKDCPKITII